MTRKMKERFLEKCGSFAYMHTAAPRVKGLVDAHHCSRGGQGLLPHCSLDAGGSRGHYQLGGGLVGSVDPSNFLVGVFCLLCWCRDSEEKLAKQAEEQARQAGELVEAVEDKVEEVVTESIDQLETASTDLLGLEDGTPESLGVMLAKVAAVSAVLRSMPLYDTYLVPGSTDSRSVPLAAFDRKSHRHLADVGACP